MARRKKVCSACKMSLVAAPNNFNKDARNKDGLRYDCKLCQYKAQLKSLIAKIKIMEEQWKRK